jgi:hypothetical protein
MLISLKKKANIFVGTFFLAGTENNNDNLKVASSNELSVYRENY